MDQSELLNLWAGIGTLTVWGEGCLVNKRKILKSKADSDANMKQDLFEFDFQLCLSTNGLVEEQK